MLFRIAGARWAGLLLPVLFLSCLPSGQRPPAGAVVVAVGAGGAGARAGLSSGDVLLSYRRGEAGGAVLSCADVSEIEIEQAPRGPVELRVARDGRAFQVAMPAGEWQVEVGAEADPACAALARARRLAGERHRAEADAAFAEAARRGSARKLFTALVLQEQGEAAKDREDFAGAERALSASLRLRREAAPGSLAEAASWHALGRLEQRRGAMDRADAAFRRALALRTRLAPRSLERASTLNNLGIDSWGRRDFEGARSFYDQALGLIRKRAPGSLDEARVLNNLGLLARNQGDFEAAERHLTESGRILQKLDPAGVERARIDTNLSTLATDRGDLARAEEYLRSALSRFEAFAPESLEVATVLNNLGIIARNRFDPAEAATFFERSLAIRRKRVPGSAAEAESLSSLAEIYRQRNRLEEAERFARQALAIREREAPGSPDVAVSLGILGGIAQKRGDLRAAAELGGKALAIQRQAAPGALYGADLLQFLGTIASAEGRLPEAEGHLRQALAIQRRLLPKSYREAVTLDALGLLAWKSGRLAEAEELMAQAVDSVEAQIGRIGGSDESRSGFQTGVARIYQNLISAQVGRGQGAAALHTLERSRARSLLAMIAERDLVFAADAPEPLLHRQRLLDREYEKTQEAISRMDPRPGEELEALLVRLSDLRGERSALVARITQASPRYASLRYPEPLDLAGIRRTLDPGTVWLSYCVTREDSYLFVVPPAGEVRVFTLPAGRSALDQEVAVFRSLLLRGREGRGVEEALLAQGEKLYDLLVAPAAPWIARAERVLISPDGPLHTLPFSALVRPGPPRSFLLEWKPLRTVVSATLDAELARGRRGGGRGDGPLVAFAAPRYRPAPAAADASGALPLQRYRRGLPPLPAAREEVRALAALYGADAITYVGAAATEKRVKSLGFAPRYLHFACHSLLDRRFPLDSALALSAPEGADEDDNGLLQAWEIFERVRIDADLVTLSACETGLGREAAGEGLIGLTRAFQYAGARSIVASLWAVSDRSTAKLMARFYALLRAGRPKDAALQAAQRELLRGGGEFSHPYHWAAFELIGNWR
jgi:CHAT domain-containing protein/tetratricopeptide (TPR) repeat protein